VAGRPKSDRHFRLASGRQLWRLNELGRLRVVDAGSPIGSDVAKLLIAAEFERTLRSGMPMNGCTWTASTGRAGGEGEPT
jgi:hypothetical protein